VPVNWEDSVPAALSYTKPADNGLLTSIGNQIGERDAQVTTAALTEANNAKNQALYKQQQELSSTAQKNMVNPLTKSQVKQQAKSSGTPTFIPPPGAKGAPSVGGTSKGAPSPGREVSITSHGHTVTVNSAVAGRFKGFLDALWSSGYHFSSVGGYANRDIHTGPAAGKGIASLHSIGYAIDVDPSRNPTSPIKSSGKYVYALPPSVGALAAKYGLSWGGGWHSYKDFMHFSVPYGGRE
jgi:hypothetical protein